MRAWKNVVRSLRLTTNQEQARAWCARAMLVRAMCRAKGIRFSAAMMHRRPLVTSRST